VRPDSGRQGPPFMLKPTGSRPSRLVRAQETTVEAKHHRSRIAMIVPMVGLVLVLAGCTTIVFPPISNVGECAQAPTIVGSGPVSSGWDGERPLLGVSKFPQITLAGRTTREARWSSMSLPMTHLSRRPSPELSTREPSLPAPLALVNGSDGWDVRTALLDLGVRRRPDHVAFLGTCPCPVGGKAAPGASGGDPVVLSALPRRLGGESAPTMFPRVCTIES
jgi:hypothetical protein